MAKIELSPEVRSIESLIDAREHIAASQRLQAAHAHLGRRPEYRYLLCLYDATFHARADVELVKDMTALVADQPDLLEATALLAQLCARIGDRGRAELFARSVVDSGAPSGASARAQMVLHDEGALSPPAEPSWPGLLEGSEPPSTESEASVRAQPTAAAVERWFERVRLERVHHRAATYGVRQDESLVDMLLDWGRTVALGQSFASSSLLGLNRAALMVVEEAILEWRRQPGGARGAKSDTSRATAAAGYFLAVVLHELDAKVIELAPDDGGCKVILPSGAGARPLLVAAAFCDGAGPSLTQTFDHLAAASVLAVASGSSPSPRYASSGRVAVARPAKPSSVPPLATEELSVTRADVQVAPLRRLDRASRAADAPALDVTAIAATLATSSVGRAIAERLGSYVSPTPASVTALEWYCATLRGTAGESPLEDWQPSDADEDLITTWGAFLGEALIASYGGVWECDPSAPSDPRLFRVVCEERVVVWPITLVYLRVKNGSRYDLGSVVATVGRWLA